MSVSPQSFAFVSDLVRTRSAIQLPPGKEYLVENRLLPVARSAGFTGPAAIDEFVRHAPGDPAALERIVEALTTNETSWFRDRVPFDTLRETVLPAVTSGGPGPGIRIWSAACSTGQEPYSVAMTLAETGIRDFSILATDLSGEVLDRARAGVYSQLEVNRGLPAALLVRYFSREGSRWRIDIPMRSSVTFMRHNLLDQPPQWGPFDVVFLRNVLIYFDSPTKTAILRKIARVVRPGGFLFLGSAEAPWGAEPLWHRVGTAAGPVYQLSGDRS
ncbi:CheR family methyltransferase [Schaalia naturae]|jgi:chemotaxis protein methyltransferase CheR|uniref:protein-glutamate O-methyltransferase n=1 Tax=Schaalia naturae TaxID=635203 RepID=A0ABW2SM91_9ACTO